MIESTERELRERGIEPNSEYGERVALIIPQPPSVELRAVSATSFVVLGTPVPQGSKWAFVNKYTKKAVMVDENSKALRAWRAAIVMRALECMQRLVRPEGFPALYVDLEFHFRRPLGHMLADGLRISGRAPKEKSTRPDLDKLVRAVFDALTTAKVVSDDSKIVEVAARKLYVTGQEGLVCKLIELKP